ncbi:odorant receptor 4-like [Cardiocondyla obscurior]|uniref:odorant receptor 4-like n=1 Tax=Cardiocondyla obscurior TaxID=286306 RepID=UPI0039658096
MFANKNYKRDVEYVFELSRFVFRLLGIWPYARTNSRLSETLETAVLIVVSYVILTCELVPAILYVVIVQKKTRARLKVIATTLFTIITMFKYSQLILNRNRMKNYLAQVEDDWRNIADKRDHDIMINEARIGRRLVIICAIFMYSSGVSFRTIIPLSYGKIVTEQNTTIRLLSCPGHFILFDVQLSPAYEIVFVMQLFSGFIKCSITTAIYGFTSLFVMHICAQMEMLIILMNNLVNKKELKNVNEKLAAVVNYQIKIRNFLQMIQNSIQYASLLEILGCTIIVCLLGYFVIMEWEDNNAVALCSYLVGLTSISFNIFLFCFIGEQLSKKAEKVALTACTLEWYRLPDIKARSLILIMIISNSSIKLKGGKFIDLSFKTFGNVVKTAVTYLNLLRAIVD